MAKANKISDKVPRDTIRYQLPYTFKPDKNFMEVCEEYFQLSNDEIVNKNEKKKEIKERRGGTSPKNCKDEYL